VKHAAGLEGSDTHGLYVRVNGAALLARGGNVIPMDNMEGRCVRRVAVSSPVSS
jgi:hypothetical protein